jgi:hypothetical protein
MSWDMVSTTSWNGTLPSALVPSTLPSALCDVATHTGWVGHFSCEHLDRSRFAAECFLKPR